MEIKTTKQIIECKDKIFGVRWVRVDDVRKWIIDNYIQSKIKKDEKK